MATQGGILSRWRSLSRPVQVLAAILIASGFAIATGVVLSTIQRTQTVVGVPLFLDANCNGADETNEQFSSQPMGQVVVFCLGVKNTASTSLVVHVELSTACPANGTATISDGPAVGDDLSGPDGQSTCGSVVAGPSKTLAPTVTMFWNYNVTYAGATGAYVWTFSAAQG